MFMGFNILSMAFCINACHVHPDFSSGTSDTCPKTCLGSRKGSCVLLFFFCNYVQLLFLKVFKVSFGVSPWPASFSSWFCQFSPGEAMLALSPRFEVLLGLIVICWQHTQSRSQPVLLGNPHEQPGGCSTGSEQPQ